MEKLIGKIRCLIYFYNRNGIKIRDEDRKKESIIICLSSQFLFFINCFKEINKVED